MPRPRAIPDTLLELLNESSRPIYAIDDRRRIVFCNPALATWLDLEPSRVIGRIVEYHSEPTPPASAKTESPVPLADLCPPPRALAGERCTGTISCAVRDGRLAHRNAEFIPLPPIAAGRGRPRPGCGVLALLDSTDLSPEDLAASADPSADELHLTIRRFRRAQAGRYSLESLLGSSTSMRKVRAQVAAVAASGANAIISGSAGSGRGHVARAIHYHAATDPPPKLIPLNCELITDDSVRRALDAVYSSGNDRQRHTLLLENLDRMSRGDQSQLLTAIQHKGFRARVIATRGPRASSAVADALESRSPSDNLTPPLAIEPALLDILSTVTIDLPPLTHRLEDLPILAHSFLEACNRGGKQVGSLRADALDLLALYAWPGELDELRDVVAAAHMACESHEIIPADLPAVVHHASHAAARRRTTPVRIVLDDLLARIERAAIERALAAANGNKTEAAEFLGMTRPRLYRRLVQLGFIREVQTGDDQVPEFVEQLPSEETP